MRGCTTLAAVGFWSIAVPFLGPELGLKLDVTRKIEIIDHVVPGIVIVGCSLLMLALLRRGRSGSLVALGVAWTISLAGLWIAATHMPLLRDAGRGLVPWGTACFHSASAAVTLALAVPLALRETRSAQPV